MYHDTRNHYAYRHKRVSRHVQIRALHIQVTILHIDKQPCRESVYQHTHAGHPGHSVAVDSHRMQYLGNTLTYYDSHRHEQNQSVEQRNEHRRLAVAVGVALGRGTGRQLERKHGKHERRAVAKIMPGIRQQSQRVIYETEHGLAHYI